MNDPLPNPIRLWSHTPATTESSSAATPVPLPKPCVPDHELLRVVGRGSYGEVWLARNVLGEFRAVKVIYRRAFEQDRPYEREVEGIRQFEPVSRAHPSQLNVLHVGRNDAAGYFYYVMELADDAAAEKRSDGVMEKCSDEPASRPHHSTTPPLHHSHSPALQHYCPPTLTPPAR